MTKTLVEQLEERFELPEIAGREKPQTLAEYVSNGLMQNGLPRISPELFELTREAQVPLTKEQIKEINTSYKEKIRGTSIGLKDSNEFYHHVGGETPSNLDSRTTIAKIPRFVFGYVPEQTAISFPKTAVTRYNSDYDFKKGDESKGNFSLTGKFTWTAPFKLDVNVKVPEIPNGFIELGDEAVAEYYALVRTAPKELRKTTKLIAPRIGVLWSPTDESLYATGEIPKPRPQIPKGCPVLALDFADETRSYRHVVAAWDIGEELPFRNWLAEYSEGRLK